MARYAAIFGLLVSVLWAPHAGASEPRPADSKPAAHGGISGSDGPAPPGCADRDAGDPDQDCGHANDGARQVRRRGTHFIAEGALGTPSFTTAGYSFGALFGLGGKLPGFPPRLYLFGEMLWLTEQNPAGGQAPGSSFSDIDLGLRLYLPLFHPVRVFLEGAAGGTRDTTAAHDTESWRSVAVVGLGAQARLLHELSVGTRVRVAFNDPAPDGDGTTRRTAWLITLTAHF